MKPHDNKTSFSPTPISTRAQIGGIYEHQPMAETRPFLLVLQARLSQGESLVEIFILYAHIYLPLS